MEEYNRQAYASFCNQNLGKCMYCGNMFYPQIMDLHVAECYRINKANREVAAKNAQHQQASNKSHQEASKVGRNVQ